MLGKEADERVGETDVTEDSMRMSSVIVNIFLKIMKAELLHILHNCDGSEWMPGGS